MFSIEGRARKAHVAADRVHDVRGERSNVPRDSTALYEAEMM